MSMHAFEIHLNGKRLCLAGIGNDGVLTAMASWVGRDGKGFFLEVGALNPPDEDVMWIRQKPLRAGDQLHIKILEATSVDEPVARHRMDPVKKVKAQQDYVRMMAKKFGWKIQTRSKRPTSD
jgi:hypothetical protein